MSDSYSALTPVRMCPHCTTLDIAHVGDTDKSRWLECRECGHVWNHSLPPAPPREQTPWPPETKRTGRGDDAERRIDDYRARPHHPAWTSDPGWPRDRWPPAPRERSEERVEGREESSKSEDGKKV
jgi:hypothetical protein